MTVPETLPGGWTADGSSGFKGPCPVCASSGRRAWMRHYSGGPHAGCPSCGATSRTILRALRVDAGAVPPAVPSADPAPSSGFDLAELAAAAQPLDGAGLAYLRGRGLDPRMWARDEAATVCHWLPREAWPESLRSWLLPTRDYHGPRGCDLGPGTQVAADTGFLGGPGGVAGVVVWIWRGHGSPSVVGLELDGVTAAARRVDFRRRDRSGSAVKRPAVPGSRFQGAAFVARQAAPGQRVHVVEGAPDSLAALTLGLAWPGQGVIAGHGAGGLRSLAPWLSGRPVTVWPHGDRAGEAAARSLRDELGSRCRLRFGRGDLGDWATGAASARVSDTGLETEDEP